jgi:hypothetical protein
MTTDLIQQLQDDVWGILSNDAAFRHIPVYRSRTPLDKDADGNPIVGQTQMIEEQIEQSLGGLALKDGKCGIVAIVMLPDAKPESVESRGPSLELTAIVRIIEDRLFNEGPTGTGITTTQLGLHIVQVLHQRSLRQCYTLRPSAANMLEEISLPGDRKAHEVKLILSRGMERLAKPARPAVTVDTRVMTATCTEALAEIWWSHDGSWPGPANPQSWKYDLPVTLEAGITSVRVVAYAPAMQPSDDTVAEVV